jgi:hypothetical protein
VVYVALFGIEIDHGHGEDDEDNEDRFVMFDNKIDGRINQRVEFFTQHGCISFV